MHSSEAQCAKSPRDQRVVSQLLDRIEGEGGAVPLSFADRKVSCEARVAKSGGNSKSRNSFQQHAKSLLGHCGRPVAFGGWQRPLGIQATGGAVYSCPPAQIRRRRRSPI